MPFPIVPVALAAGSILSRFLGAGQQERQREAERASLIRLIDENTSQQLRETGRLLNREFLSRVSRAKQSGARQALALGRKDEAASFTAPIESAASNAFASALERSIARINENARSQKFSVATSFASRPLPPSGFDAFADIAEGAAGYALNKDLIETQFPQNQGTGTGAGYKPDINAIMGGSGVKRGTFDLSGLYRR